MVANKVLLAAGILGLALSGTPIQAGTPGGTSVFMALGPESTPGDQVAFEEARAINLQAGTDPESVKNPRLAMLYSLLLPGMGEIYLGHQDRGAAFLVAEAGIWTTNIIFNNQADTRKRRYKEFAQAKANVGTRKDDEFYRQLGIYLSSDGPRGANETIRRVARAKFPNDRDLQDAYVLENGYFGEDGWEWSSEAAFETYGDMRGRTLDSEERARLSVALLIANRLLSVVDTGLLGRKFMIDDDSQANLSWDVNVGPKGPNARVVLSRVF